MTWRSLTPEEARAHPRYGLRGWLGALFALHLLLSVVMVLATLSVVLDPASSLLEEMPGPRWLALAMTWSTLVATVTLPLFAILRSPLTAIATAIAYGGSLAVGVLAQVLYPVEGVWPWLAVEAGIDVIILRYLFVGLRPNVTFRRRVPA